MIEFNYNKKIDYSIYDNKCFEIAKTTEIAGINELINMIKCNLEESRLDSLSSFYTLETDKIKHFNPKNQNFNKNYELIFSGCSQTNAEYISIQNHSKGDYKQIWGFQVAEKINKETINLALGSWGADTIVKNLLGFFSRNGNPKILLVLFPDFSRFELPETKKFKPLRYQNSDYIGHQSLRDYINDEKQCDISKSPHKWKDIVDQTVPLWQFLQAILILEQYCKSSNIFLRYSSWDSQTNILLHTLKENTLLYKSYAELDSDLWLNYVPSTHIKCHEELNFLYDGIFHMGSDNHHMGIHRHVHIAEGFLKEIEKYYIGN